MNKTIKHLFVCIPSVQHSTSRACFGIGHRTVITSIAITAITSTAAQPFQNRRILPQNLVRDRQALAFQFRRSPQEGGVLVTLAKIGPARVGIGGGSDSSVAVVVVAFVERRQGKTRESGPGVGHRRGGWIRGKEVPEGGFPGVFLHGLQLQWLLLCELL